MQEEPEDNPSVVKELIGMWDSLANENRWTSGRLLVFTNMTTPESRSTTMSLFM